MRTATVTNFAKLAPLLAAGGTELYKALAQAVTFELSLPQLYLDQLKGATVLHGQSVSLAAPATAEAPGLKAAGIRSALATKWATPSDNPILTDVSNRVESFFHTNMPEMDLQWTNLFDLVDLRTSQQDSFEIIDTNAGIAFQQIQPGAKIKVRREIAESQTSVPVLTYGDGIGLQDDWLRFQKFWKIEEVVSEFRAKWFDTVASAHYSLFTSQGAGINQAFAVDDTQTFNAAAARILRDVRDKGYGAGPQAQFWIVCAPEHVGRILKMLEATQGSQIVAFNASAQPIAYRVAGVIATTYVPANSTGYYLVLPGRKIKRGLWKDLSIESGRDIYTRATDWVGHGQFNAIVGDSVQVRRVLFA